MNDVPTQLDMRENTASSRRRASRLAVSPSALQTESPSMSEHEDTESCERMPPILGTFNLSLREPEKGPHGKQKRKE